MKRLLALAAVLALTAPADAATPTAGTFVTELCRTQIARKHGV